MRGYDGDADGTADAEKTGIHEDGEDGTVTEEDATASDGNDAHRRFNRRQWLQGFQRLRFPGGMAGKLFVGFLLAFSVCGMAVYGIVSIAFPHGLDANLAAQTLDGDVNVYEFDGDVAEKLAESVQDGASADQTVAITVAVQHAARDTFLTLLLPMVGVIVALSAAAAWLLSRLVVRPLERANRDLAQANADLEHETRTVLAMERERRDFFAAASHELKTPVAVLRAQIEGMMLNIGDYTDHDAVLPRALDTVSRMQRLVGQTLAVSHMDAAEPGRRRWVNLGERIAGAIDAQRTLARRRGITFDCAIPDDIEILAAPELVDQAFDAVIGNAAAYATAGSTARITARAAENPEDGVILTVANRATQLDHDDVARLGEPFFRPDASRSTATGGSGLGIHIAHTVFRSQRCEPGVGMADGVFAYTVAIPAHIMRRRAS